MNKNIVIIILLLVSIKTVGQKSYFKEAVITRSDDTYQRGYIEKVSESNISNEIKFKSSLETNEETIIPIAEVKQILFLNDSALFQNVPYESLKDGIKVSTNKLGKKLLDGYCELFKVQLPEEEWDIHYAKSNTYVYILFIENKFYTLDQKEKQVEGGYTLEKNYQRILSYLLRDYSDLSTKILTLRFKDKDMISLFNDLNKLHPEIESSILLRKEKATIIHEAVAGYVFTGVRRYSDSGNGLSIGYNISFIYPHLNEKYFMDLGVSWNRIYAKSEENYDFIRIPVGGGYRFSSGNFAPYFKLGFTFTYFVKYSIAPYVNAKAGVKIFNKVDINAELDLASKEYRYPYNFIYIGIGYLFSKGKR